MVEENHDKAEYLKAVEDYEKAEAEANKVRGEVFSSIHGALPARSITDDDVAIINKSHSAWEKIIAIARRPTRPGQ
jgi:hypothetical protein